MAAEQGQVSSCGIVVRGIVVQAFRVDSSTTHLHQEPGKNCNNDNKKKLQKELD